MFTKIRKLLLPKPQESESGKSVVQIKSHAFAEARTRIIYIILFFMLIFGLAILKLIRINIFPLTPNDVVIGEQALRRGEILDRNGEILATNIRTTNLVLNHKNILSLDETIDKLKSLYPKLDYEKIRARVFAKSDGWTPLVERLTPNDETKILNLGLPGLEFIQSFERIYPQTQTTGHYVGYINRDKNGALGMERQMDAVLKNGENIKLAMDIRVQAILHEEITKAITKYRAIGGAGMVLNAHTGEVLAMVSLPDFNPNTYNTYAPEVFFNKATQGSYELGSTMKLFNSAAALDSGLVKMSEKFDATQSLSIGKFTIHDYHAKKSWLSLEEIFIFSSNIGSARMALKMGYDNQKNYMKKSHFLEKLPMEFPENNVPLYPKHWKEVEAITISFGHGISISPMQLAAATIPAINDGNLRIPRFIAVDDKHPVTLIDDKIYNEETIQNVRKLMRLNALDGSGKTSDIPGYLVGGKTGTAEKPIRGIYNRELMISSYIAGFPIHNPQYVIYALIDEPKPDKGIRPTGGIVAAPIVGAVIKKISPLLGLKPLETDGLSLDQTLKLPIDSDSVSDEGKND